MKYGMDMNHHRGRQSKADELSLSLDQNSVCHRAQRMAASWFILSR
jgi:hypothetical protein